MSVIQFWPMLSVVSPTGLSITAIRRWSPKSAQRLIVLGWGNLWIIISLGFVLYVRMWPDDINANQQGFYAKIAIFFAFSRSVEIAVAFLRDAVGKIKPIQSRSKLTKAERIRMVFKSYLELILDFAIVAYFSVENMPASGYEKQFSNISDAIYFSAITITTTGYRDNYPTCEFSKYLSVFEVLSGTILIGGCVGDLSRNNRRSSCDVISKLFSIAISHQNEDRKIPSWVIDAYANGLFDYHAHASRKREME